jgi:hypothetical protein
MWSETKRLADEFAHKIGVRDPFIDLYIQQNLDWEKEYSASVSMPGGIPWTGGDWWSCVRPVCEPATTYSPPTEPKPVIFDEMAEVAEALYQDRLDTAQMLVDEIHRAVAQELCKMFTMKATLHGVRAWDEEEIGEEKAEN